ncbi:hypothetical protein PLESTB_000013800 [Pleodorina starrii]|uniref:K Homology domain-containing protein n=1 Tax=Pleodorina starrii TaxID=330485 RepID=A0A9W6B879_9CHLO|nr:hypothetical protein PLESTM_001120800 [Pleodorina starrii]GLC47672.1 hypothetical protein PLESTB_000013800 [Pleodorina starrii]GLC70917.1 hypothetical protein PLESTF_001046500 [Pleodorina starrii]
MLGPLAFEAQAVVTEHVLTGPLARYRHGSLDELGGQVVLMKLCVSNALAGSIIGRGGHNRDQLQLVSGGARIQLSRPNELYPGTPDRVLVLTGTLGSCLTALFAISGCLGMPGPLPLEAVFMGVATQWKLILPSSVCGYILGAGGRTVRAITAQADANISISAEPDRDADLPRERIATISGGCLQTLRAMGLIVDKLLTRPFVEPGEPAFEGQFPSSRVALLARTGHLRNPPGVLQQHMPPHMLQQQHQQQQQQQPQQPGPLAPAPGQALYAQAPAAGASAFVYFPLQQLQGPPAQMLPVGIPHAPLALQMAPAAGPPRMPGMPLPGPVAPAPMPPPPMAAPAHSGPLAGGPQAAAAAGGHQQAQANVLGPRLEVSIEVPENRVGLLIGRGGETLHWMQRLMNVSIHIARRHAPAAGEAGPSSASPVSMRRVTISGARNAVNIAHAFILQRLSGSRGAGGGEGAARH